MPTLVEIKARCANPQTVIDWLRANGADFLGVDHQIDTYFKVPEGRLKLRQGNVEQNLIFYQRPNQEGPKQSDVLLHKPTDVDGLKQVLASALGVLIEVDKRRSIFFIDNVKFHVDEVRHLGRFLEIEAIDEDGSIGVERLRAQCDYYMQQLGVDENDLVQVSYSDMLLRLSPD